jgi:hypothetical protein
MNVPKTLLPLLVIAALLGGYFMRSAFTKPTTQVNFTADGSARLECVVEGLKCKGTANFFTRRFQNKPGIASLETFATEHLAVFTYDPDVTSPEEIRAIIEAEIPMKDGSHRQVFRCVEMR